MYRMNRIKKENKYPVNSVYPCLKSFIYMDEQDGQDKKTKI
jgi:hypothetical protein